MKVKGLTLVQHIRQAQRIYPHASGEFSSLLNEILVAAKIISREVNRAGIMENILGKTGCINVQGEEVQKLDEYANTTLLNVLRNSGHVCVMASEEIEDIIKVSDALHKSNYAVIIDPLDGSSNIDVNASIGTIFSIYKKVSTGEIGSIEDILRKGSEQIASGYIIYGSGTILVYGTHDIGVYGFTLDPSVGEFLLSHPDMKMPETGKIFSTNEGNYNLWSKAQQKLIDYYKEQDKETGRPYSARYIGSLVADFHRTLLKGGIFMYPADKKSPNGKLRYLCEAAPLSFIAELAGGMATNGEQRILEIQPKELHERTPLFIGSKKTMEFAMEFLKKESSN